jgi:hypothetical protein
MVLADFLLRRRGPLGPCYAQVLDLAQHFHNGGLRTAQGIVKARAFLHQGLIHRLCAGNQFRCLAAFRPKRGHFESQFGRARNLCLV